MNKLNNFKPINNPLHQQPMDTRSNISLTPFALAFEGHWSVGGEL